MSVAMRRSLTSVHRWVGLTLGLVVMLSALTGAGMAFRKQLDPLIYPGNFASSVCSHQIALDALVARAESVHLGTAVDYVRLRAGMPVIVRFIDKQSVFVDPCNGAITGEQNRYAGLFGTLEFIHRGQWLPGGGWLMGSGALALIVGLAGIGLWLWWPRRPRGLRDVLKIERRLKGPAFTLGLHRTVGGWGALFLLASAIAGLPNAFEIIKTAMVDTAGTLRHAAAQTHGAPPSLESQWAAVQRLTPAPQDALIHVSRKSPDDPIETFAIEHGAPHANARTYIYLDSRDGQVLRFAPYAASGLGNKAYFWMLSFHTGSIGLPGELAIFFGALCALVQGYTGIGSWLKRSLRKRRARRTAVPDVSRRQLVDGSRRTVKATSGYSPFS